MICVGIDVAKDKHDCFILSSEGEVLADVFTIQNNAEGFDMLLQTIRRCARPEDKIKVGLEASADKGINPVEFYTVIVHNTVPDTTATTFLDFCLTKAWTPTSSIRCTPTSTEKA